MYEVTTSFGGFLTRSGRMIIYRFMDLGLTDVILPNEGLGEFYPERVEELLKFVREHREYHIISLFYLVGGQRGTKINSFVPGAHYYYLGEGDPNPRLVFSESGCFYLADIQSRKCG